MLGAAALVALAVGVSLSASPSHTRATGPVASIASPDTAGSVGANVSLALDESGNPVISYADLANGDLRLLHCGNPSCTNGNSITSPDTDGDVGTFTSLALDASGNPVVSYFDASNDDLKVLHCGNPNCTDGNSITAPDTDGDVGTFTSLALDAGGNPVVSYFDASNDDLKVLHCGDPNCSAGNSITSPDTNNAVGLATSLVLDGSGYPVVSYKDVTSDDLKVLHCGNPDCTAGNSITAPDTVGNVGGFNSLVLDASGNPVVSYSENNTATLKLLHCGNPNCTADNSITTPYTARSVGLFTSLALDASGNPVISSYDTRGDLRVLRCGDPNCTAVDSVASPDVVGVVTIEGKHTSLALDAGGSPIVAYFDGVNDDLKVLHCADSNCTEEKPITPTPTPTPPVGDADCDGTVASTDAALVLQFNAGLLDALLCQDAADVNGDGSITSVDAALILQFTAGLLNSLPP